MKKNTLYVCSNDDDDDGDDGDAMIALVEEYYRGGNGLVEQIIVS